MNLIQRTVAGFSKSASRRMDAELCIVNLCQPELTGDMEALLSRLTRLEDQVKAGFVCMPSQEDSKQSQADNGPSEGPAASEPALAAPVSHQIPKTDEAPIGFWADVTAAVRNELKTPAGGFFVNSENAQVHGVLQGDVLYLVCANPFTMEIINKPDIIALVRLKASAKLGRQVRVAVTDKNMSNAASGQMEQLLAFGRDHSDRINIK